MDPPTSPPNDLVSLLDAGRPDAAAIGAPAQVPLTYGGLRELVVRTRADLRRAGVGRGDRVAMVVPDGPETAAMFVAVASAATAAPLNPAYQAEELSFYLSDLDAKALILPRGSASPARRAAEARGIPILALDASPLGLVPDPGGAPAQRAAEGDAPVQASDVALVLHTSGTTARPKIVPLTHANLCASARHVGASLGLGPGDVCLNIMPLFHIHGLVAAVLASLAAGASVSSTPGFNALKFFGWLDEVGPTWYTAVPTMHQAILARAPRNPSSVARSRLRLVRSSSASLPPAVMRELEALFRCPVIEAYGMTEAAHQMASNPLPPRARKPGSVGVAAGPEVAIMDERGAILDRGVVGEVVIRGPNVILGYENNPEANARAFSGGGFGGGAPDDDRWFRTGDLGALDEEGYLHLAGRLKELINRGGEKVSPLEVDAVLMEHPAVRQAVTFAMPHDKLGEEVAAAVVLREDMAPTEREIREFAASRLAAFKVPRRVVFVAEIPKGPTGKPQRVGLAERLGVRG